MASKFQLYIYRLSQVAPLAFVFAALWYFENATIILPLDCFSLGGIVIWLFFRSFRYAKHHVAPIQINVSEITPKDGWLIGTLASYLLPLNPCLHSGGSSAMI